MAGSRQEKGEGNSSEDELITSVYVLATDLGTGSTRSP